MIGKTRPSAFKNKATKESIMTEQKYSKMEIKKAINIGFENGKRTGDTEINREKANYMAGYAEGFIEGLKESKNQQEEKTK